MEMAARRQRIGTERLGEILRICRINNMDGSEEKLVDKTKVLGEM